MASFSWQPSESEHFGNTLVPVAHVQLTSASGVSRQFLFQVDSGAVVSFARRSVGDLLKLDFAAGRRIELKAVGGRKNVAYVHDVSLSLNGGGAAFPIPLAIAESEAVPNLLGRTGVFDVLQVHFDPTLAETKFLRRWLDWDEVQSYRWLLKNAEDIVERWKAVGRSIELMDAVGNFINRAGQLFVGVAGLVQLNRTEGLPPLVRGLFELSVQLEYLMQDPLPRAAQFQAFRPVSKWRQLKKWTQTTGGYISDQIRAAATKSDFDRVKSESAQRESMFRNANGKLPLDWHKMKVVDIAKAVDRADEYDRWYSNWSAWTHGDPFVPGHATGTEFLLHCQCFYARMLLSLGNDMILTAEQSKVLERLAKPFT